MRSSHGTTSGTKLKAAVKSTTNPIPSLDEHTLSICDFIL